MKQTRIHSEVDFGKDGKQTGFLRVPYSVHRSAYGWIPVPVVCLRNGPGPNVLLVSGNHGDEYEGQVALIKLIRDLRVEDVRGRIIILPAANYQAVMAGQRNAPDEPGQGGNLNRAFPGDPDLSPTAAMAHYIETNFLAQSDYVLDLHSGGGSLTYLPCTYIKPYEDAAKTKRMIELMQVFGAPIGYVGFSNFPGNLSSAAMRQGILHLGTELAGSGTLSSQALVCAELGVRRVLRHIGSIVNGPELRPPAPVRLMAVKGFHYFVYSPEDGIFEPLVELGDAVAKGQPAARVHFPDTPWREPVEVRFEQDGLVICRRHPSLCRRADCLFHLATDYQQ